MDPTLEVLGVQSDYAALSRDANELIEAFALAGCTQLAEMKEVWRSRGFSFIYEARPMKLEPPRFMQTLYSSALVYLSPAETISWRLGALFVLYILYQTQNFTPKVKIYLSLENLQWLLSLVKELRTWPDQIPMKVVRCLVRENALMYGHTSMTHKAVQEAAERRVKQVEHRIRLAQSRLFANVPINEHLFGRLDAGLEKDQYKELFEEYNQAKQNVFERLNGLEQQQTQVTIHEDMEKATKEQEEFRAAYFAQKRALQESNLLEGTNSTLNVEEEFDTEELERLLHM